MRTQFFPRTLAGISLVLGGVAGQIIPPPSINGAVPAYFASPTNFPIGSSPGPVTVADFNKDGNSDVAVVRYGGVSFLTGDGNGFLTSLTNCSLPVGPSWAAITAGDFNNDGALDLFVARSYGAHVLSGDGAGNFTASTNLGYHYSYYPAATAAGDFNGDGKADFAIADMGNPTRQGVTIGFGRGDGSFGAVTNYPIEDTPSDIRLADVDGNGSLDLVLSLRVHPFCVLTNSGNGTFGPPQFYTNGVYKDHFLEVGDFNGDGKLDIAELGYDAFSLTIWTNSGKGLFARAHSYKMLALGPTSLAKGDFNGDGKVDLMIRGGYAAAMLSGNGDGSFVIGPQMGLPSDVYPYKSLAVADFDSNKTPDLLVLNYSGNSVAIMLNQTPPTLQLIPIAGYIQISWPSTFGAGFNLEYTTNLSVTGSWQSFPYPPVVIGNQKFVADWADQEQKFYRLRKPSP